MGCGAASAPAASRSLGDYGTPDWRGPSRRGTLWPEERHLAQEDNGFVFIYAGVKSLEGRVNLSKSLFSNVADLTIKWMNVFPEREN